MRITDLRADALSCPIDPPQQRDFAGGTRTIRKRDVVLVRLETADGLVGVAPGGASSSAMKEYFNEITQDTIVDVLRDVVAPALIGTEVSDPTDGHRLVAEQNLPEALEWEARSVVDIALHDLFGKVHGTPVYDLLPGSASPSLTLPMYASAGMYMKPEMYAREARQVADDGFFGYKYRPGIGPRGDRETIELIREEVGHDIEVMVDAHTWWKAGDGVYDPGTVRELVVQYTDHDVYWVEEPVPPTEYGAYRSLHEATGAPLAGGESETTPEGLVGLAETGAVEFLQGDVRHHGGFTGCWDAVAHCTDSPVTFVPHVFGTHLGLVANAHLTAAAPESQLLEYPVFESDRYPGMYPFPLAEEILETDLTIESGELTLPDGDGLGVEVNEAVVDEYPHIEGPWTEFDYN